MVGRSTPKPGDSVVRTPSTRDSTTPTDPAPTGPPRVGPFSRPRGIDESLGAAVAGLIEEEHGELAAAQAAVPVRMAEPLERTCVGEPLWQRLAGAGQLGKASRAKLNWSVAS